MSTTDYDVLIIGAGLSGINGAYRIQEGLPEYTYAVLEARNDLGGTWSFFKYPGIRSDSDLFTFGFAWDPWRENRAIATAPSIIKYLRDVTNRHGIDKHIKYRHKVLELDWQSDLQKWKVKVQANETENQTYFARFIGVGSGYYDYEEGLPTIIPGLENFKGQIVHPQFWPEDLDYADKKVAIIGSGATAVTILPSMYEKTAHISMVQRSPGYFVSMPEADPITGFIQKWLPVSLAGWLLRWRFLFNFHTFYYWCQLFPTKAREFLISETAKELPPNLSITPHFQPTYKPWEQRMCVAPSGGDFFKALRSGKADVVTGHIDTVTENGIRMQDGQTVEADIIITATGLKMQFLGKAALRINGSEPIQIGDKFLWRGSMLQDVPNLVFYMGYTNASWTLGCDAQARMFVRLLQNMQRRGDVSVVPKIADPSTVKEVQMMNLSSSYIQSAMKANVIPKCGDVAPWKRRVSYFLDSWFAKFGDLSTGLEYTRGGKP
ncbi:hypothetical protein FKW77_009526 [Venturia effusa]|uniref:FAD/NAD(P)-binding domain-containing protein n=1 Tax=Venturia effusa TaxID=50376 RepID=A0A517L858_9PEZI|nr:hypothetical protein FKW77_009526 [Venturia effusa]